MKSRMFAAIDVGSNEVVMKIFNITTQSIERVDEIRYSLDLGSDTYTTGKIKQERVDELCRVLKNFSGIMDSYHVKDYRICATSAIRETENTHVLLDLIEQRTGMKIEVLSNSEQRFLDYKSVASRGDVFNRIIEKGTAIVDIGGGSIQLSLFDKDSLIATQNMRIGVLRIREMLYKLNVSESKYPDLIEEIVGGQLEVFKKLYLKEREIENIIIVDDYLSASINCITSGQELPGCMEISAYGLFLQELITMSRREIIRSYNMPEEHTLLLIIAALLVKQIVQMMQAENIWAPGVTICDGMAYEYAEKSKIFSTGHDFEQDIIACAKNISKRYMGSRKRSETLEQIALTIFDSMKKVHGLGKRERLLLRLATLLHDCGKYISLNNLGNCGYDIIMSTEIIGLSHREREIVANVVRYNHMELASYDYIGKVTTLAPKSYLIIAKLTAILRVANGLDRSHKQKFKDVTASYDKDKLIITICSNTDITLEQGLFREKAELFEEVFSVRPVIRQKRKI